MGGFVINARMIMFKRKFGQSFGRRLYSIKNPCQEGFRRDGIRSKTMTIADTPLGKSAERAVLLDGLDVYTVDAMGDGHPLCVFGINSTDPVQSHAGKDVRPILLLHGRTWSSIPVYHLLGGAKNNKESRSLMETLHSLG